MLVKIVALCTCIIGGISPAVAKYTPEQVKAVYLYRIATFIQWENEEEMREINICVVDDSAIEAVLRKITQDKQVRNKPLRITKTNCHVLYFAKQATVHALNQLDRNIVTIGGTQGFTASGGAIELVEKSGKIRPKVDLGNIQGYRLSANFLRVADVEGGRE
ncbi:YfiR family protein [Vibrio sp. RE86]|nr:YfiR family protein [Vibrio sp. RE86]